MPAISDAGHGPIRGRVEAALVLAARVEAQGPLQGGVDSTRQGDALAADRLPEGAKGGTASAKSTRWLRTAVAVYSSSSSSALAALAKMSAQRAAAQARKAAAGPPATPPAPARADDARRRAQEDIRALAKRRAAQAAAAADDARRLAEQAARVREVVLAEARQATAQRKNQPSTAVILPPIELQHDAATWPPPTPPTRTSENDEAARAERRALREKLAKNHADALAKRAALWQARLASARAAEQRADEARKAARRSARRAAITAEREDRVREEQALAAPAAPPPSAAHRKALAAYRVAMVAKAGSRAEAEAVWRGGMARWRSRRKLDPNVRIFTCSGWEDMRNALKARGWVENTDHGSPYYNLQWAGSRKDVNHGLLIGPQAVNYHCGSHLGPRECLTTKVGLASLARGLHMAAVRGPHVAEFYPDCFDLSTEEQAEEFRWHFRWNAASAILRLVGEEGFEYDGMAGVPTRAAVVALRVCAWRVRHLHHLSGDPPDSAQAAAVLWTPSPEGAKAMARLVSKATSNGSDEDGDGELAAYAPSPPDVTEAEWACMLDCAAFKERRVRAAFGGGADGDDDDDDADYGGDDGEHEAARAIQAAARGFLTRRAMARNGGLPPSPRAWTKPPSPPRAQTAPRAPSRRSPERPASPPHPAPANPASSGPMPGDDEAPPAHVLSEVARDVLAALRAVDPQQRIAGDRNVWIIKPACMSRGRGIGCYNSFEDIVRHANLHTKLIPGTPYSPARVGLGYATARTAPTLNATFPGAASGVRPGLAGLEEGPRRGSVADKWVVQRYIERPLVVKNRKFDLRQWVVVSSWNPMKVWFYDKCYVRFAAEDYQESDISNVFAHLTNNCIARHSVDFATRDVTGEGNMWPCEKLAEWLDASPAGRARIASDPERVKSVWADVVKPAMQAAVTRTVQCGQEYMLSNARENSHQLYGYDFMLDEDLGVWLIEVNTSPQLTHSTSVTERMVKALAADLVKLMVDAPVHEARARRARAAADARASNEEAQSREGGGETSDVASEEQEAEATAEEGEAMPPSLRSWEAKAPASGSGEADPESSGGEARAAEQMDAGAASIFDDCETGDWKCIYADAHRIAWPRPGGARPGLPLVIDGKAIKVKRRGAGAAPAPLPAKGRV